MVVPASNLNHIDRAQSINKPVVIRDNLLILYIVDSMYSRSTYFGVFNWSNPWLWPSWPRLLDPQEKTFPHSSVAKQWLAPQLMDLIVYGDSLVTWPNLRCVNSSWPSYALKEMSMSKFSTYVQLLCLVNKFTCP